MPARRAEVLPNRLRRHAALVAWHEGSLWRSAALGVLRLFIIV